MRYLTSFPPDFAFSRGSGEFLFLPTKIQNIYYFDNQSVTFLNLFRDYPYLVLQPLQPFNGNNRFGLWHSLRKVPCFAETGNTSFYDYEVGFYIFLISRHIADTGLDFSLCLSCVPPPLIASGTSVFCCRRAKVFSCFSRSEKVGRLYRLQNNLHTCG